MKATRRIAAAVLLVITAASLLAGVLAPASYAEQFRDVPDAAPDGTAANGINARGQIVGGFVDVDGNSHGFLANGSSYTTLDCPGGTGTTAWSINSTGQIAGTCNIAGQGVGFVANPVPMQKP